MGRLAAQQIVVAVRLDLRLNSKNPSTSSGRAAKIKTVCAETLEV
jgi:hypothetical protein